MNKNIVIVTSSALWAKQAVEALRGAGFEADASLSGAAAFARIAAEKPWLLMVGETLADEAGHALLR